MTDGIRLRELRRDRPYTTYGTYKSRRLKRWSAATLAASPIRPLAVTPKYPADVPEARDP
jgi:hypothetical protein